METETTIAETVGAEMSAITPVSAEQTTSETSDNKTINNFKVDDIYPSICMRFYIFD